MIKKLIFLFLVVLFGTSNIYSQEKGNEKQNDYKEIWSRITVTDDASIQIPLDYKYTPAPQVNRIYVLRDGSEAIIEPNVRPLPTTNTTQSEMSIDIHPSNPNILFMGANATPWPVAGIYGTGTYISTNAGETFFGWDNPPYGTNSGDPAAVIGQNGNFYMGFIDGGGNNGGQGVAISTNNGTTWVRKVAGVTPGGSNLLDKNHLMVDKHPTSPYVNRVYAAWTRFQTGNPNNYDVEIVYSTDNGNTWSTPVNISNGLVTYLDQGVNIQTGPNGEVYVAWAIYDGTSVTNGEDAMGFNVSTNGGVTWGTARRVYNQVNFGIRGTLSSKASIRVASFPSMAVNRNNNHIYMTWPQRNVAPAGSDPDIVLIRSTDGGANWSNPVRVNQDPLNNGKDQYYPWATVDQKTGHVYVVYYDSRNVRNDSAEVYISRSIDGGLTFEDIKVSDASFRPKPITGLAGGYQGDYIGIVADGGVVYPYWCDDRTGNYQGWLTKAIFVTYPLNAFNINTPSSGVTLTSFPGSSTPVTITWDTASSTATYKWIFGNPASQRLLSINASTNNITMTSGQLDIILANAGLLPGDSLVGQWDVWAYRNNPPDFDSLKSANGPRAITLKRGIPALSPFSLVSPANNTSLTVSTQSSAQININWTRSGEGNTYKWKLGSNLFEGENGESKEAAILTLPSNNNGFDSSLTLVSSFVDAFLGGQGLLPGDSVNTQWTVYAYNGLDSLKAAQTFNITLKRQAKGEVVVVYDSSAAGGRESRDTVLAYLNRNGITYDMFNKGTVTSTNSWSFRDYKRVIWLGQATSTISAVQRDSLKAYMNAGGPQGQKARLIIFSEDVGYQHGRSGSTNIDLNFVNQFLGWNYVADRPPSGANQGLRGDYINTNMMDSTIGTWPDVFSQFDPPTTHALYRYRSDNTIHGIGKVGVNHNAVTFGTDVRSIRRAIDSPPGASIDRMLSMAIVYVDNDGIIPVELTSFKALTGTNSVTLEWTTATETNNQGFFVERKTTETDFMTLGFVEGKGTTVQTHNYSYVDVGLSSGTYQYRLRQVDYDGTTSYSDVVEVEVEVPTEFSLSQNYPNPFNPSTMIVFTLPTDAVVTLKVFDVLGQEVVTLLNKELAAGKHETLFDATKYNSGVYLYRMEAKGKDGREFNSVKKMLLLK